VNGGGTVRSCAAGSTLVTYGDGSFCTDSTATQLVSSDRAGNAVIGMYGLGTFPSASYDLAADAVQGAYSLTLLNAPSPAINPGDIVWVDEAAQNDPNVYYGPNFPANAGSEYWNACPYIVSGVETNGYRNLCQVMEVMSTSNGGKTITFSTPFTYPFHTSSTCAGCEAAVTVYGSQPLHGAGVENVFLWGGNNGNIEISDCDYCWVKNVEGAWSNGPNVQMIETFKNVLRDSFLHETDNPNPGGAGYQMAIITGASENLVENNEIWYGNKVNVMPVSGGGNVFAYNYTDDAFGSTYPQANEAGINAGHRTTGHLELLEGNYSFQIKGDDYWGGQIFITDFRNWISQHRAAHPPLNTYSSGACPYGDYDGGARAAVDLQAGSYYNALIGNVFGTSGQTLTGSVASCIGAQSAFMVDVVTSAQWATQQAGNNVPVYQIGIRQTGGTPTFTFINGSVSTVTRTGNWDRCCNSPATTGQERCYDLNGGMGGTTDQGCSGVTIPNSFYLSSKPSFFGTYQWPWVDPTTGTTYTLPAMYCFQQGKMPTCIHS